MKRIDQSLKQKLDCSQIEEHFGEGYVMDWYEDDEMVRHWEEISKEEEKIAKGKMDGKSLQVEGAHRAPELLVSQVLKKERCKIRRRRQVRW